MRIGLVSGEFPPAIGGVGDHTARLAAELRGAGHDVQVLTTESPAASANGVPVSRLIRKWDHRVWWQVPRFARAHEWEILHIQYQPAMYALHGAINVLPWFVRSAHPAIVTTFHDVRFPYLFPKAGPLRTAAVAALAKGSDAVIAVSDDDLPQLQRWRAKRPPKTSQHVPLGDQLDAPLPAGFSPSEWRARHGLGSDMPLIAYFGLLNESKGVLDLVEALSEFDDAHLLMIGDQLGASDATNRAYLSAVRDRIEHLRLSDRVHWTGFVSPSELSAWLEVSDVVALPYTDGASLRRTSLITAWRRGKAVVTTEPASSAAWFREADGRDAACFVPARDSRTLAVALRTLLLDPVSRAHFASAGNRFAERFSWPSVVAQTVAVYQAAISARRA